MRKKNQHFEFFEAPQMVMMCNKGQAGGHSDPGSHDVTHQNQCMVHLSQELVVVRVLISKTMNLNSRSTYVASSRGFDLVTRCSVSGTVNNDYNLHFYSDFQGTQGRLHIWRQTKQITALLVDR